MAEIQITNLRKEFGNFVAVEDSSFTVRDGEFFMLLGPSGCGKTTTLRMMAGLELPTAGQIFIDGEDVTQRRARDRDIAFVFQMYALYPHFNVFKNLAYPLTSQGMAKKDVMEKIDQVADILDIRHLLKSPVSRLSGGDRQRVALGRAIVREPKAFFMDEPLGALDAEFREQMAGELRGLHDRMGSTTIYVTHDQLEAMQMGDKIVVMNHGVIEQFGSPQEIYDWPATRFVADFIGSPAMNFLPLKTDISKGDSKVELGGQEFFIPEALEDFSGDIFFGVRPEHVSFDDSSLFRASVDAVEYLGTTQLITLQSACGSLKARIESGRQIEVGAKLGLSFDRRTITLFNSNNGKALLNRENHQVIRHG